MSISSNDVLLAIEAVDSLLDEAVTALGQSELKPVFDAIASLAAKAIAASQSASPEAAVEVVAADAAAQATEDAKFGGPGGVR